MVIKAGRNLRERLGIDLEGTAKETKAFAKREITSAKDLLRLILFYVRSDWSLRLVGAWALLVGIGYLSDVAVLKRLRNSQNWIGKLVATTISVPGSQGIDWRIHLSFDLGNFCLDGVEITDKH